MNLQKQINELTKEEFREIIRGCEHDGSFIPVSEVERLMNVSYRKGLLIGLKELKKVVDDELGFMKTLRGRHVQTVTNVEIERIQNLTTKSEKLSKQIKKNWRG